MKQLADAERATGKVPPGCEWLDEQTIEDLDLEVVHAKCNRTVSIPGAQALWRWLVAPMIDRATLEERDDKLRALDLDLRKDVRAVMPTISEPDAELIPELLWGPTPVIRKPFAAKAMFVVMIGLVALLAFNVKAIVPLLLVMSSSSIYDMVVQPAIARQAHSLDVLSTVLDAAARIAALPNLPPHLRGTSASPGSAGARSTIDEDLKVRGKLSKYVMWLRWNDPIGIAELLRASFGIRSLAVHRAMTIVVAERERLQRIVLWVGELDAMAAIATLRTKDATQVPTVNDTAVIEVRGLVHPALKKAVGNDLSLAHGMLITGSNASGKSTFLRAVAINAILAQSLRVTFGSWSAPLLRVRTAMRISDDITAGKSTYFAEVECVGKLVHDAAKRDIPTLFVLDEPFHGTNPAVRVPIVVAILEHLVESHFVMAATHDLDVAHLVSAQFERGYFTDGDNGDFDHKLKSGIAPSSNAVAMLRRAGYPDAILQRIEALQPRDTLAG